MTVRIGWDEYEVALLIDACNRIRDNKIDKAECVHKLSNLLRQRAKANGINIDEVFRNENGIALQMTKMEYLLTDGKKDYRELVSYILKWQNEQIKFR